MAKKSKVTYTKGNDVKFLDKENPAGEVLLENGWKLKQESKPKKSKKVKNDDNS